MAAVKTIKQVVQATVAHEGAGFLIHRPFPSPALPDLDPFLLVDEMGPIDYKPGEAKGAPDHPHRGFETITYLLAGEMEHADSAGHAGTLRPGDLQWMTAGSGVIHAEMPSTAFQKSGGRMHGFQLWVNLAAKDKRMEPRYQELSAIGVPQVVDAANGVTVKVLSGRYGDVAATVQTQQPVLYLDVALAAGGLFTIDLPEGQTSFAYVFAGEGARRRGRAPGCDAPTRAVQPGRQRAAYPRWHGAQPLAAAGGTTVEGTGRALWTIRHEHGGRGSRSLSRLPGGSLRDDQAAVRRA